MKDIGYIYVLANGSMPNAVKVGKTTRSSAERARELSGVTSLPTAFIVVYEQLFEDCTAAENFVHALLEQKGFRISANREFFSAPVSEVVKAITLAPGAIQGSEALPAAYTDEEDELFGEHGQDELDDLILEDDFLPESYLWYPLFEEAENYRYGHGDTIQDYAEALRLYSKAAKLGSLAAYAKIGEAHEYGIGTAKSKEKALSYYKEGARRGNAYCYWLMGSIFTDQKHYSNANKALSLFLKNQKNELPDKQHRFLFDEANIIYSCITSLVLGLCFDTPIPDVLHQVIVERKDVISLHVQKSIDEIIESTEEDDEQCVREFRVVLSYLEDIHEYND
ncbi:GIY-YIG nuclease family protein [Collimonas antrihumi]|uniref:GIY-YIG nuclease family protein n=1 Tax=Collimonas antrihumi TaxID=1940615 RepID=UPI001B8C26C9|nr:GIY-YIG nuclease family protein [Collimonas antrihumi]